MRKKKYLIIIALLIFAVGGAAGAIGIAFTDTVNISFGEVDYQQSDLIVDDYRLDGPGNNVDSVDIDVNNTATSDIEADVSVYLISSGTEVASGTTTQTFTGGQIDTTTVSVPKTPQSQFDEIDIRIEET